jgi:hypothetical protein
MGLNLELTKASTLEQALKHFTEPEVLEKDNAYKCPKCKKPVPARKQFTVYRTPPVLYIQLKRFTWSGAKIHKNVKYPLDLDLSPFTTENNVLSAEQAREVLKAQNKLSKEKRSELLRGSGMKRKIFESCQYELYGVLVHIGGGCRSGHYICYVKSASGVWHRMDDSNVQKVSVGEVLSQSDAYLLFYRRKEIGSVRTPSPMMKAAPAAAASPAKPATPSKADPIASSSNGHKAKKPALSSSSSSDNNEPDSESDSESDESPAPTPSKPTKSTPVPIKPSLVAPAAGTKKVAAAAQISSKPNPSTAASKAKQSEIASMLISSNGPKKSPDHDLVELESMFNWSKSKTKKVQVEESPSAATATKKKRKRVEEPEAPKAAPAPKKQKASDAPATPAIAVPALKKKPVKSLAQLFGKPAKVGSWKDDDEAAAPVAAPAQQRAAILAAEETQEAENARGIKKRRRDDLDKEYDLGKLPKRRKKTSDEEVGPLAHNKFQTTAEKSQKKKQREIERGVKSVPPGGFSSPAHRWKKQHKPQIKERRGWKNL